MRELTAHLQGPGELMAAIPVMLGFTPRESVVVIGVAASGDVAVVMRLDRADALITDVVEAMTRTVGGHLARAGACAAVLVAYTDDDVRLACPALDAMRAILTAAVDRVDAFAVVDGRYFSPGCADDLCCPPAGQEIPMRPIAAEYSGGMSGLHVKRAGHDAGEFAVARVPASERKKSTRACERWWGKRDLDAVTWRSQSWELWCASIAPVRARLDAIAPTTAGKLIAALRDPRMRDAAVISLIPNSADAALAVLEEREDADVEKALSGVMNPFRCTCTRGPCECSAPVVAEGLALCDALRAHARAADEAPMLTMRALAAWWQGDGPRALDWCELALNSQPGYRLAELLAITVRHRGVQSCPSGLD